MAILNKEQLHALYIEQDLTDKEIAEKYNVDRTAIVHLRKQFKIETKKSVSDQGIEKAIEKLLMLGFNVKNMKSRDKTALYDLLVNGNKRVEIISASALYDGAFRYITTSKEENNHIESEYRIQLPNKRFRKIFSKTCDFIIFYGVHQNQDYFWIMPSNFLNDTIQTIALNPFTKHSKYKKFQDAWHYIK